MSRIRFGISTLFWLTALVAVFFLARQPIFDPLFPAENLSNKIELDDIVNWHQSSHPDIVTVEKLNDRSCRIIPVNPGMCTIQFETASGLQWFVISVSRVRNVTIQPIRPHDNVVNTWRGGRI